MKVVHRGEIYWIEPHKTERVCGSEQFASRPGVIVSNDTGNKFSPVVEVVYLSGRLENRNLPTHVQCKALYNSVRTAQQITTVSKTRLGNFIRRATAEEMRKIDTALAVSLGLEGE